MPLGNVFEDLLTAFGQAEKGATAASKAAKPATSKIPNPLGVATTMPPVAAGGELTAARQAGPLNLSPAPPRKAPLEPTPGVAYSPTPQPKGGELTAAREARKAGQQQPVPRSVQREQAEAAAAPKPDPERVVARAVQMPDGKVFTGNIHSDAFEKAQAAGYSGEGRDYKLDGYTTSTGRYVSREEAHKIAKAAGQRSNMAGVNLSPARGDAAPVEKVVEGTSAKERNPVKRLFEDIEKNPSAKWRSMPGGRIAADAAKGNFNIYNLDQRRGKPVEYLRAIEDEAQARGLASVRVVGPAAARLEDTLKNSNYTQEGKAWIKKLSVAGAVGGGAAVAGGDQAEAAGEGGYSVELPNGKTVTFPAGTTMDQVQETVARYNEETKPQRTGLGGAWDAAKEGGSRVAELFSEGVGKIRRGGEQLAGDVPTEQPPDILKTALGKINQNRGVYTDQGPPTEEQQRASERSYQKAAGVGNMAAGVYDIFTSPWGMVSKGLEHYGGKESFPHEVTEAVLGLTTPLAAIKAGKYVAWGALPQTAKTAITNTVAKMQVPMQEIITGVPNAERELARELIRQRGGTAARETATTQQALEEFRSMVNKMPDHDRLDLYRYIEGRSVGQNITNPAHQKLADTLRTEFMKRKTVLQNMSAQHVATFIEDYFPHMWSDPRATAQFMRSWGQTSKQGSGANLRKRSLPTIADGLAAGLTLKTTDPVEATMAYVSNMDRYIATNKVIEEARGLGRLKYYMRGDKRIPSDWRPLSGRLSEKPTKVPGVTMHAYAPRDFAVIYNNFIDKGIHAYEGPGQIYDAALKTSNAVTALELGLSGFHAVTMANEATISKMATGIRQVVQGAKNLSPRQVMGGVTDLAKAPGALVSTAIRGGQVQRAYLGATPASGHMQKIVDLLEHAGGRAAGFEHAPDYKFSAAGSYWTSFKRASLKAELAADVAEARARPIAGSAKVVLRHVGRVLQTAAQPLFEKYIPNLKNGAFYDAMTGWLKTHPGSSQLEQLAEARRIWDSVDNRFGEMVQDNIFWWKYAKQASLLTMRSYSWNLGTVREIGGGAADAARGLAGKGDFSSRAAYVIAMTMQVALMNAVYQYLKTGKSPESITDLMAGQTGGEAPGARVPALPRGRGMPNIPTSRQAMVPERVMVPGYQKDVFGWYEDWQQEMSNKRSSALRMTGELATNRDWKNDPIFNPEDSAPQWLKTMLGYLVENMSPISVKNLQQGKKTGSNINVLETMGGLRPAPSYLQDPEGHAEAKRRRNAAGQSRKQFLEKRQKRQYGGSDE